MQALPIRRLCSKKNLKYLSKTFVLLFVFAFALLGTTSSVHAAGEERYKDLFGPYTATDPVVNGTTGITTRTQSGVYYIGATKFFNGVKEFYIGANLMFPGATKDTPNDTIEKTFWDYVGNNDGNTLPNNGVNDTFVIRTYKIVNGQPDLSTVQYKTDIYTKFYKATGSTVSTSGGGVVASGGSLSVADNAATHGNTLYKQESYTDSSSTVHDKYLINQLVNIPIYTDTAIPYGTQMGADFWYCGGRGAGVGDGDFSDANDPDAAPFKKNIEFFTTPTELCGGTAYWKIGPSITFTMPASASDTTGGAIDTSVAQAGSAYSQGAGEINDNLPNCSMNPLSNSGTFMGCISFLVYYAIYKPIAWFAGILGQLFDFFLGYSLSDASYRAEFAVRGWQIVRDISNIFFIIILVWTGLSTVFNSKTSMKQVVPQLILNALLINFSLFGTRVVIDLSNVVARVFYKSVQVCEGKCEPRDAAGVIPNAKKGIGGYTPLSEKIVSAFNPQKIFTPSTLSSASALPDNGTNNTGNAQPLDQSTSEYAGYYIVVSLIAAFILFGVAMMFWKTAFFFVGRVIGLYMAMIFAPFAVLTKGNMPLVGGIKELSWSKWLSDLTKYALLAPIFVFFLYVIYSFLETDFIKVYADKVGTSFFETIVYIAIPMIIVYFMIKAGVKIAEDYAGEMGKAVQGFVDKTIGGVGGVIGGGVGLGAGAAAFLGRNVVGRGVKMATKTKWGSSIQTRLAANADKSKLARWGNQFINKTQTGSFDVRNAGIKIGNKEFTAGGTFNKTIGLFGAPVVDQVSDKLKLGQKKGTGGIKKIDEERVKKRADKQAKRISYSHLSDAQAKEVWEKKKAEAIAKYGEQNWENHVESIGAIKTLKDTLVEAEKMLKEARDTSSGTAADNLKIAKAEVVQKAAQDSFEAAKLTMIKDIKEGKNAAAKAEAVTAAAKIETDRFDQYGTIKNSSGLEIAMRAEYAQDLRKNSFWMKDGKPRTRNAWLQSAAGAALAIALPGIGTIIGGIMIKNVMDGLNNITDGATNKLIKDAKNSQGRGSAERQLSDKLEELKKKVTKAANDHHNVNKKFDEFNTDDLEAAILQKTADLELEIADLKNKRDAASAVGDTTEQKKHNLDMKKKKKEMDDLEDALDEIERTQDKLDKIKDKKDKDKKDGDKKGDDKKDDKKPKP